MSSSRLPYRGRGARRRGAAPILTALLAVVLGGCGGGDAPSRWTTTVDTLPSGTVHVLNVPPAAPGPTWTVEEELRIGTLDEASPASFGRLLGLAVLADGGIAVLDDQAQEVRVFGPDGTHLATWGGKGGGPGELQGAFGLMRGRGDVLWVPEHRNARMSVFHPTGGFRASYPLRILSRGFVWNGVMAEDGRIFKPSITLEPPRRHVLRVYGQDMSLLDSLPLPEPAETDPDHGPWFSWEDREGGAAASYPVPFHPQGQDLVDPTGTVWSTSTGDPSYRIKRWTPGGDTTLVLETRRARVPVTEEERDSAVARVRDWFQRFAASAARQDWSRIPDVKPAVRSLFTAEDGRLWVETSSAREGHVFDVYDQDGRYAGTAVTALRLYDELSPVIRGDRFWAVVTDDLDVPYVVRGRIDAARPLPGPT